MFCFSRRGRREPGNPAPTGAKRSFRKKPSSPSVGRDLSPPRTQLRKTPTQLRKTPTQLRKTPTQLRKTATQLRKTPTQLRKTATQLRKTAMQLRKTGRNLPFSLKRPYFPPGNPPPSPKLPPPPMKLSLPQRQSLPQRGLDEYGCVFMASIFTPPSRVQMKRLLKTGTHEAAKRTSPPFTPQAVYYNSSEGCFKRVRLGGNLTLNGVRLCLSQKPLTL